MGQIAFFPLELEGKRVLVEAILVREVLGRTAWLPLPHPTRLLPGVMAYNGRAVPVVDLARALGLRAEATQEQRGRLLIVWVEDDVVALPIDGAREVLSLDSSQLEPPHAAPLPFATAEVHEAGTIATVIDLRALIQQASGASAGGV